MPAKKWLVTSGIAPEAVQMALFQTNRDLRFDLMITDGTETFSATLEVDELWAGNSIVKTGCKIDGMFGLRGKIRRCPKLTRSEDLESVAIVDISFRMFESSGRLEVTRID